MKTQYQKIISVMLMGRYDWYLPQDFMQSNLGDNFVGYEASARLSELAKNYPDMIESQRDGKYLKRRLKTEDVGLYFDFLPEEFKAMFIKRGVTPRSQTKMF